MKTFTKKHAAFLLTTLALGLGGLHALQSSPPHSELDTKQRASGSSAAASTEHEAPPPTIPLRQWKEGESFTYEIDTARSMTMASKGAAGQTLSYHVMGTMTLTVMGTEANRVRLRADVIPAKVDVVPSTSKDAKRFVSGTFYLRSTPKGENTGFLFPKEIAPEARILLKGLVNSFQLVVPPKRVATWRVTESDVTGQYHAEYVAVDDTTLKKSKIKYVSTRGPSGFLPLHKGTHYAVESSATFGIDASGWPKTLVETESVEVSLQGNRARGKIDTKARLLRIESHPEWAGPFPTNLESDTVSEAAARAISMKQADLNMVGGRTFATIADTLRSDDGHARNQAQARMAALMRVDPSQSRKALDEVLHGKGDVNSKKRLIGALGSAGTPEAQHELARLLDMRDAGSQRVDAAIALGRTKHPTEETSQALRDASQSTEDDVANTAILASGNVVRTMNADGTGDTSDMVQMLMDGLAHAQTDGQRQVYLDALGNTGDPRVLSAVVPYLSHANVSLRASATGALKFMIATEVDPLIVGAMTDSALAVRKAAVHTIAFRPIDGVLEAADALLKTEPEIAIRTEILKGMNVKLVEEAGVLDSVTWTMENDPSPVVRAYAKQIVEHYKLEKT